MFGSAEVGHFALSFTIIQVLAIIGRSGLDIGMFKQISSGLSIPGSDLNNHRKSILYILVVSVIFYLLLYLLVTLTGGTLFTSETTSRYVVLFSIAVPFYALMFFNAEIHRARKHFAWFSVFQNFGMYVILCVFLVLRIFIWEWNFEDLVKIFVIALAILSALSFIGTFTYRKQDKAERGNQLDQNDFKTLFKTSIPIGVSALSFFLMNWLDGVVLAQFYSVDVVGKYAIAYRVALLGSFALISINSALGPRISVLNASNDIQNIIAESRKSTKLGFWITFPLILITLLLPKTILGIFGEEFISAYPVLLILLAGQFFNTILGPTGIVLQLTGQQRIFKNIVLFTVVFNIIANYLVIPEYGIIGAAIVNSASMIIWKFWSTLVVHKVFGKTFFYLPFLRK
jgi:O-antigen/teichoic acid export membrane protein